MVRSYLRAKHDIVWIMDSNIAVECDSLLHAATHFLDSRVGLVHHAPEGVNAGQLGAMLEQLFLNTAHTKIYVVFNYIAVDSCVVGKSTLISKPALDKAGGLGAFGKYMAEDNMIGIAIWRMGLRHIMSCKTARQPLIKLSVKDYIMRRMRWTRIRAYSMPGVTLVEPFSESIVAGLTGAFGFSRLFGLPFWPFFWLHMLMWLVSDVVIAIYLSQQSIPDVGFFMLSWLMRELSAFPIYLYAILGSNVVTWRGRAYRLQFGGTVEPLPGKLILSKQSPTHSIRRWPSCFAMDLVMNTGRRILEFLSIPAIQAVISPTADMKPRVKSAVV